MLSTLVYPDLRQSTFADFVVQNYHLQLPPPHNTIIIGGAKQVLVHDPDSYVLNEREDQQFEGVPGFYESWPTSDLIDWKGKDPADLARIVDEGGCWSGGKFALCQR